MHSSLKISSSFIKSLAVLAIAGLLFLAWAIAIEPRLVVYKHHDVEVKGWPVAFDGYTIAFITDIHVGSPYITLEKLENIVSETNALKPDMVLLGGDYVNTGMMVGGEIVSPDAIAQKLSHLIARDGVFAVLGNHDHWYNSQEIQTAFERNDIVILENASQKIEFAEGRFWIAGVSDYNSGQRNIGQAYANIPDGEAIITLTHTPDIFPDLPNTSKLTLAGHTHGGQVYIPFFGRYIIPSKYGKRYAIGEIEESGRKMFVGSGIGTSILPIRFLTLPEVSILHIRAEK